MNPASIQHRDGSTRPASTLTTPNLPRRWHTRGDQSVRDALFERFLPLARKLAGRYMSRYEPTDGLRQVAAVGLLVASDRFDPIRGVSFASFAVPIIFGELKHYFRDTGWSVHVRRCAREIALRVAQAAQEITDQTGRSPDVDELADHLGVCVDDVLRGLGAATAHYAASLERRKSPASSAALKCRSPVYSATPRAPSTNSPAQRGRPQVLLLCTSSGAGSAESAAVGARVLDVSQLLGDFVTYCAGLVAQRSSAASELRLL